MLLARTGIPATSTSDDLAGYVGERVTPRHASGAGSAGSIGGIAGRLRTIGRGEFAATRRHCYGRSERLLRGGRVPAASEVIVGRGDPLPPELGYLLVGGRLMDDGA